MHKLTESCYILYPQKANEKCNGRVVFKTGGQSRYLMSNCKCWQESGNIGNVECLKTEFRNILTDSIVKDKGKEVQVGTKRIFDEI